MMETEGTRLQKAVTDLELDPGPELFSDYSLALSFLALPLMSGLLRVMSTQNN